MNEEVNKGKEANSDYQALTLVFFQYSRISSLTLHWVDIKGKLQLVLTLECGWKSGEYTRASEVVPSCN